MMVDESVAKQASDYLVDSRLYLPDPISKIIAIVTYIDLDPVNLNPRM